MSPTTLNLLSNQFWGLAAPILLKCTLVLLASWLAVAMLRRAAASSRHLLWTLGVAGVLALPLLSAALPAWEWQLTWLTEQSAPFTQRTELVSVQMPLQVPDPGAQRFARPIQVAQSMPDIVAEPEQLPARALGFLASLRELDRASLALLVWELGFLSILLYFGLGRLRLRSLERAAESCRDFELNGQIAQTAREIGLARVPRLLCSRDAVTPMTWGVLRPVLLLPAECTQWSEEQRRDVLLHELHHIKRRDAASQGLAQLACALFWFHPLVWMAERSMRRERERACDDQVLMAGSKASSYANHLLTMARSLRCEQRTAFASVAMARRSELSSRLLAVLDPQLHRSAPGRLRSAVAALLCITILLPLAAIRPVAEAAPPDRRGPRPPEPVVAPTPPLLVHPRRELQPVPAIAIAPEPVVVGVLPRLASPRAIAIAPGLKGDFHLVNEDGRISWRSDSDGRRLWVESEGEIELNADETDIVSMDEDAYFEIGEGRGRSAKRVEFVLGDDGQVERSYFEGRQQKDFDADAQKWLAELLPHAVRNLGINVEPRTQRIYERGGTKAFLQEMDALDSDWIRKQYFNAFLDLDGPSAEERREVLREMAARIDSDYERAELLIAQMPEFLEDAEMREALIAVVPQLDSDYERSRVLQSALEDDRITPEQTAALLEAARGMGSDYERSRVLTQVRPIALGDPGVRDSYFSVMQGLASDYERSQVLQALLREASQDEQLARKILEATADIDSDYERGQVLGSMLGSVDLGKENMLLLIEIADGVDSDYERANLLIEIARADIDDEDVREALLQAIDRIDSEHEYGRVMRAVRGARN